MRIKIYIYIYKSNQSINQYLSQPGLGQPIWI